MKAALITLAIANSILALGVNEKCTKDGYSKCDSGLKCEISYGNEGVCKHLNPPSSYNDKPVEHNSYEDHNSYESKPKANSYQPQNSYKAQNKRRRPRHYAAKPAATPCDEPVTTTPCAESTPPPPPPTY